MSRGRRVGIAASIVLLGVIVYGVQDAPRASSAARLSNEPRFARGEIERVEREARADEETPEPPASELRDLADARLIASVRFEPETPCVGEDVRVHVRLLDEAGQARVVVDGKAGAPGAIRPNEAGIREVRVLARTWDDRYERHLARVDVQDCGPRLGARITSQRVGERHYVWRLEPAPEGAVTWDLGDGTHADGVSAEHRYAPRADRTHSTYAVTARYEGPNGPETARASVTHVEAEAIAAHSVAPVVRDEGERFVSFGEDGLRTTRTLTSPIDAPLDLEVAELRGFPCDGADVQVRQVPASEVFDWTHLEPGSSVDVGLFVPNELFDGRICQLVVRAGGLVGERVATTTVVLDTGVPDERRPIEDERLRTALAALAAERSGEPITAEEIAAYFARTGG